MKKIIIAFSLVTSVAFASENITTGTMTYESQDQRPVGLTPFLGLGSGYTQYNKDLDVEGVPSSVKALGSYYTNNQNYVFDLGLGLMNQQFSQKAAAESSTTGASLEAAARYQWANRWQAGAIAEAFSNKGEIYGANQADAQFAGIQVLKEFNFSKNVIARLGGRLMTDININNENVQMAMIDFQIGLNEGKKSATGVNTAAAITTATPAIEKMSVRKMAAAELKNQNLIYFDSNSAELTTAQMNKIQSLAQALAQHPGLVSKIEIVGHADQTGSASKNEILSAERAEAIAKTMENAGIRANMISMSAVGSNQPATTAKTMMNINRRAEIKFYDVKDAELLQSLISTIH